MELIDRKFSQKIANKYTNLKLFTNNFAPITSTKRIIPRMKWLELIYALPYLVLRREILNSFRRTKNVFASAKKQIWNILVQLEFPRSRYEHIITKLDRFSRENIRIQYPISNIQANPVSGIMYHVSSSFVNLMKSRGFYFKSSSIELAQPVSHETPRIETEKESAVTNYQLPIVTHQPTVGYTSPEPAKVETEKELAVTNYQLPVVTLLSPTLSHKHVSVSNKSMERTSILPSAKKFITTLFSYYSTQKMKTDIVEKTINDLPPYFNFINNKQMHLNTSGIEKVPLYHTYPKIEHVTSTHTEIITERIIEKEAESKPPLVTPQLPRVDVNRLTDQVYQMMERKVRIERERRGL